MRYVMSFAENLAKNSPLALRGIKRIVNDCIQDLSLASIENAAKHFIEGFLSDDFQEEVSAFLEKRTAVFR